MDIFIPIVICFVVFLLFSLCGMCCRRNRDQGAIIATPVVITSTQHHVGPYPVTQVGATTTAMPAGTGAVVLQQHTTGTGVYPMPQPQMPNYNTTAPAYPTQAPYPMQAPPPVQHQQYQQMPMPMPGSAPPAMPPSATMMNPPSYNEVVSESYAKQAPYNPHFSGQ
ncbi:protein shisa-5 [Sabethes cyaneus]|uniref:protein shisa-5 n=1 Tax=Sabethes cyaneus TaxID=53552 RepID=UPI00237DE71A|nr:protein shisa-5 [Sabethes cyaneus]